MIVSIQSNIAEEGIISELGNEYIIPNYESIEVPDCAVYPPVIISVTQLLLKCSDYNWPIFEFSKETSNHSLTVLSQHLFTNANFFVSFNIPKDKFRNFLLAIEKGYHADLPYHNSIHATDVLHCYAILANLEQIGKLASDIELMAMYIAAIIHGIQILISDHDHPGLTNNFLVTTYDSKALLYNDKAVLESHHTASSFVVLLRPDNNFLYHLSKSEFKAVREIIIDLVLATGFKKIIIIRPHTTFHSSFNVQS
jgi:hypothetical protein